MIRVMKRSFYTGLGLLAGWLVTAPAPAAAARHPPPKTSIPKIARLGKIQVGYSTQAELARHWGEGKTIIGGHANSGRLWRVKGTPWIVDTDAFEYSRRGLVVDGVTIYESPRQFSSPE